MAEASRGSLEPGFLPTDRGPLFLLTYPARGVNSNRAVVVFPAFAEEMNKCRRQIALAAREFANRGITTYLVDLAGTGDSHSDFGDATLAHWRADLKDVLSHVRTRGAARIDWLAVRAGALLALDALEHDAPAPASMLLWQPVLSGKTMMSQFLRLKAMAGLGKDARGPGVGDLRTRLATGNAVEVAGYWLNPALVSGFDDLHLKRLAPATDLHWFAVQDDEALPAAAATVVEGITAQGGLVAVHIVKGEPFWSTAEIALAPELIRETCNVLAS